jgi:hypothetical protein
MEQAGMLWLHHAYSPYRFVQFFLPIFVKNENFEGPQNVVFRYNAGKIQIPY